jgi:hypothetical protein
MEDSQPPMRLVLPVRFASGSLSNITNIPPSSAIGRDEYKQHLESVLRRMHGGAWRVDIFLGRYGWCVRAIRLPMRHRGRNRVRSTGQ